MDKPVAADRKPVTETTRKRAERRLAAMKMERSSWEHHWRELAEFMLPRRGRFMLGETNKGDKRHRNLIDGTPYFAARTLASGMMAGLTSPARPWFRLTTPDPDLAESGSVKQWLHVVEQRMQVVLSKSNLYQALSVQYGELGVFGTQCMIGEEDDERVVRFIPLTIGSYAIATNHAGRVDSLAREFKMTVRQLVQDFGYEKCSERVKGMYDNGHLEQWIDVCHVICPNDEREYGKLNHRGKAFKSLYWEASSREGHLLREAGFSENRILAARWDITGEDIYGTSPGMAALGDAKALQVQEKRKALAIDKYVDPAMNVPASLRNTGARTIPGGVNYIADLAGQNGGIRPLYEIKPDIQYLLQDEQEIRDRINTAMYADLFMMLAMSDRRQITAREVEERHEEKLLMLGPVLERLNTELLDPLIDFVFAIMLRKGLVPEPPEELGGVELRVEYISVLAQAQRMVGLGAIDRLLMTTANMAAVWPEARHKVNAAQVVDDYAIMLGVSPRIIRTDDEVEEMQAGEQQQQQMAQMAQMAPAMKQATGAIADLANAPSGAESILSGLSAQMAGGAGG